MRGTIKLWNEARGFGFIKRAGEADVFAHANNLVDPHRSPLSGDEVQFEIAHDERSGKTKAVLVEILGW